MYKLRVLWFTTLSLPNHHNFSSFHNNSHAVCLFSLIVAFARLIIVLLPRPVRNRVRRSSDSDAVDLAPLHKASIVPVVVSLPINWSTQEVEEEVVAAEAGGDSKIIFLAFVRTFCLRIAPLSDPSSHQLLLFLVYLHYQNYRATDKIITLVEEAARARK